MSEFGELLRHARAYKGVTLREAERVTKINRHHLAALEREEFEELPPLIYARGIVRTYARYLGLDPVAVLALFEDVHGQRSGGFRVVPAVKPLNIPSHWAPNFAIIAFMVVMSAVIFAWVYGAFRGDDSPTIPQVVGTPGAPTVTVAVGALETPTVVDATPPAEPTEESVAPADDETAEAVVDPTEEPTEEPTAEPTEEPTPTPTPVPEVHTFTVTATQTVWLEVTVDGTRVFASPLAGGQSRTFEGKQMYVTSGNAPFVRVTVDGVDQGPLGTLWSDSRTYP